MPECLLNAWKEGNWLQQVLKQGAERNFKLGDIYVYSDTEDELLQHFTIYSRGSCEAELLSRVHFPITSSDSAVILFHWSFALHAKAGILRLGLNKQPKHMQEDFREVQIWYQVLH